ELGAQIVALRRKLNRLARSRHDRRRHSVGEEIRPRTLTQQLDDRALAGRETATRAAKRLAERARQNVDALDAVAILGRAAPAGADNASGVRVIDVDERVVALRQIANLVERSNDTV